MFKIFFLFLFVVYLDEKVGSNVINEGDLVRIKGLKENAEFNRLYGRIVGYDAQETRYKVEISNVMQAQRNIAVKVTNIELISNGMLFIIHCLIPYLFCFITAVKFIAIFISISCV